MSDEPEVLISEGRHAIAFHTELGSSRLAACGKNAQHDQEFVRVPLSEALEEYERDPCQTCPIPDDWLGVDRGEGVVADGGERSPKLTANRDDELVTVLVDAGEVAVLATASADANDRDVLEALSELDRELEIGRTVLGSASITGATDEEVLNAVQELVADGGRQGGD